ncbi:MAG: insulinase family protein [Kofleriaceae bacterium]|nr:insulinase family protein [Kofleriaceae bacterium]MBP6841398.1 insulinase family protein [Kofleriaceae bacterium]MBP9206549.1 insulinase family protein [Kofleriaceae bacterium]
MNARVRALATLAALLGACCPQPPARIATTTPVEPPDTTSPGGEGGAGGGAATAATPALDWAKAGPGWATAPEAGPEPRFSPPSATSFRLGNGLQVVLVENHRLPLVSLRVVNSRAGAREDGARPGLAAMTADLLDEGAGSLTALTLPEALERLGADLSVSTSADAAIVSLDLLASTLPDGLTLLGDVMLRPTFAAADVERIKSDRLAALATRPDSPRRVASLVFDRVTFGAHPYGHPGDGFATSVGKLARADVLAFWRRQYAPAAATLVIAGDVDRATVEPLLEQTLGAWKAPAPRPAKVAPARAHAGRRLVVVDRPDAPQTVIVAGRLGVSWDDPRYAAAEVINTAIGGSFAARLNNRLREQLGYTYGIFSSFWRGRLTGAWSVTSSIKTAATVDAVREALAILDDARGKELPAAELAKAQQLLIRGQPQDFETNAGIAGAFQRLVVAGLPLDWYATWADRLRAVDAAAARTAAHELWADLDLIVVGDWKVVGAGLSALGVPVTRVDADGNPVAP